MNLITFLCYKLSSGVQSDNWDFFSGKERSGSYKAGHTVYTNKHCKGVLVIGGRVPLCVSFGTVRRCVWLPSRFDRLTTRTHRTVSWVDSRQVWT